MKMTIQNDRSIFSNGVVVLIVLVVVTLFFPQDVFAKKDSYKKALKTWTRQDEKYQRQDLYSSVTWSATLQSEEFVKAKADKMNLFYQYKGDQRINLTNAEISKFSKYTSFFVSFYTYQYKYSDVFVEKNNWKIFLVVDDKKMEPLKHEKISDLTPVYQELYPYSNLWSQHYYIYFPKIEAHQGPIKLMVTGPLGNSVLEWN